MAHDHILLSSKQLYGNIKIKTDVFYSIVLLAVEEEKRAQLDKRSFKYAVDVSVDANELMIKLDVKILYGKNVNDVCKSLQDKIIYQIELMTGLVAKKIDVNVIGFMINAH